MAKRLGLPISFKLTRYNTQLRLNKISTFETRISVVQYYMGYVSALYRFRYPLVWEIYHARVYHEHCQIS